MNKIAILMLLSVIPLAAQSHSASTAGIGPGCSGSSTNWPANSYPCDPQLAAGGLNYLPDDQIPLTYVAYYTDQNGSVTPINGLTVYLYCYTTMSSGWHSHESGLFISGRPQPVYLGNLSNLGMLSSEPCQAGIPGTTSGFGTVTWQMQLPGYAGWYSFYVRAVSFTDPNGTPQYLPEKGLNFYAKYGVYTGPLTGTPTPYPDTTLNQPQLQLIDINHQGQTSRNFLPWVIGEIEDGSTVYRSDLVLDYNTMPTQNNVVNVWRGSLQDGGEADNFPTFTTSYRANWLTPEWEEHAHASEVDVYNPAINANPGFTIPGSALTLMADFFDAGCPPGKFIPNTTSQMSPTDAFGYWSQQSYIHLTCGFSALPHYSNGHGH